MDIRMRLMLNVFEIARGEYMWFFAPTRLHIEVRKNIKINRYINIIFTKNIV